MADLLGPAPDVPPPLDRDGVRTVGAGTLLWAVAALVCLATGRHEATATCLAGVALGVLGVAYCRRRRDRSVRPRS